MSEDNIADKYIKVTISTKSNVCIVDFTFLRST